MTLIGFLHHPAHARTTGRVLPCHLRQRHTGSAIQYDLFAIHVEPRTSDLASFKSRPSHAAFDPLYQK
jgi:hypothetical protein